MHRSRFYALLRAFFKLHISHTSYPIFSFCQSARNVACNFSAISVKLTIIEHNFRSLCVFYRYENKLKNKLLSLHYIRSLYGLRVTKGEKGIQ